MVWLKRHRRILLIVLGSSLAVSVLTQMLFPSTAALPFTTVVGERVDFKSREDIAKIAQEQFSEATVKLQSGDKAYINKLSVFGAVNDPDEMASEALDYPLVFRLIPFSALWYHPRVERFALEFKDSQLVEVAKQASQELSSKPTNASLAIKNGELQVETAVDGRKISAEVVLDAVKQATYGSGETTRVIEGERLKPTISDDAIAAVKNQAEAMLARELVIEVDGDTARRFMPSGAEIAQWITIEVGKTGTVSMTLSPKQVSNYIASINREVETKPTTTIVTLRDGKEQSREKGKPGQALPTDKVASMIIERLTTTQEESIVVAVSREEVTPPVQYKRSYSASQAGLTAYVKYITSKGDIKIAVRQLDGDGLFSYGGASDSIPAASTYKLFVMLRVLDDIRRDQRGWNDKLGGETLSVCFERMIVVSANNCSEALIEDIGAQKLTDYLRDKGFSDATDFNHPEAIHTSAADLIKLLSGIENKSLVSSQESNTLLEKMARQVYRNGIPATSEGTVYNKVGFLWDYNHDAAIVRHPEGTYVAAIMTKGYSFDKIAEITRQIESIMYP